MSKKFKIPKQGTLLLQSDTLKALKLLPDESVHSIVTDPPYGLSKEPDMAEVLRHWLSGDDYKHSSSGFMGKSWDSFVPGPSVWKECLRILKPGGHLLCFAGSRTVDLMGISIRLAGFEIRDQMQWLYGSGFPKSMDVSKAINKIAVTDDAKWNGWGTALKPAHEPIIVARKPFVGTVATNVLAHETGAINIDASRIGNQSESDKSGATPQGKVTSKEIAAIGAEPDAGRDLERVEFTRPELKGRFPANLLLTHHDDCVQQGVKKIKTNTHHPGMRGLGGISTSGHRGQKGLKDRQPKTEKVERWVCHRDCPVRLLDEQTGDRPTAGAPSKAVGSESMFRPGQGGYQKQGVIHNDKGGASRYFYCGKTSKKERNAGLPEGIVNNHPTVKPVALMQYLVRLVTPPGGICLDPYVGSGTTALAANEEAFRCIGIDDDKSAIKIAKFRIGIDRVNVLKKKDL